jgi:hypothetical protein
MSRNRLIRKKSEIIAGALMLVDGIEPSRARARFTLSCSKKAEPTPNQAPVAIAREIHAGPAVAGDALARTLQGPEKGTGESRDDRRPARRRPRAAGRKI